MSNKIPKIEFNEEEAFQVYLAMLSYLQDIRIKRATIRDGDRGLKRLYCYAMYVYTRVSMFIKPKSFTYKDLNKLKEEYEELCKDE